MKSIIYLEYKMQPLVALWITVLLILLALTIFYKDHTSSANATVIESDCLNVTGAQPCVAKVKYEVDGATYVQQVVTQPGPNTLVGMNMPIRYNKLLPNQAQVYKTHVNIFVIPTAVWLLLGIAVLFFLYNPITVGS